MGNDEANENRLQIAIDYMEGLPDENHLGQHQRQVYAQVATRFKFEKPMASGESQQIHESTNRVLMEASVYVHDEDWQLIEYFAGETMGQESATERTRQLEASCGLWCECRASADELNTPSRKSKALHQSQSEPNPNPSLN